VVNAVAHTAQRACLWPAPALPPGVHYLDQANELEPVRDLLELDDEARRQAVTLVTGAGFGVLATEALVIELRSGHRPPARAWSPP